MFFWEDIHGCNRRCKSNSLGHTSDGVLRKHNALSKHFPSSLAYLYLRHYIICLFLFLYKDPKRGLSVATPL